jgi:CheY-like chemotaxis protein/HPt (histidine-containing phosphotransfer) domain-containing protein
LPVLVVDDNATNRRILYEVLTHWRMRPTAADGGIAALTELRHAVALGQPFPLLLIDAQMPDMDGFTLVERIKQDPTLSAATIMMLSSADLPGDAARCRSLGVAVYLTKPIKQSELLDAILTALGAPAPAAERIPLSAPSPDTARPSLRILLAEDNVVNQKLVTRLLEKRGHTVMVAEDGRAALAAIDRELFDVVLMDVQMPEMDGLEATAAIRAREQATGAHLQVVAMTAHAMKGDEERCLDAGMDGYVSKPISAERLFEAIDRVLSSRDTVQQDPSDSAESDGGIDRAALLRSVDGDLELLRELTTCFLADCPRRVADITSAVARRDGTALEHAAHALKGSAANLAAPTVFRLAQDLERMGRLGDWTDSQTASAALEKEMNCLKSALITFGWCDASAASDHP